MPANPDERSLPSSTTSAAQFESSGTFATGEHPRVVGRFTVEGVLGTGGMSVVLDVRDERQGRHALKLMRRDLARDMRLRQRFLGERAMAMRIDHPTRVAVTGEGEHEGAPYLLLERVDGESVEHIRRRLGGRMPVAAALRVLAEVLEFLDAAHRASVLHRDIKPTNVLLTHDHTGAGERSVRIIDFGIAQVMGGAQASAGPDDHSELTLGTPSFLAPEAVHAPHALDVRADLFAAGALFLSLVTGHRMHRGRDHDESLFLAGTSMAPSLRSLMPEIDHDLARIVDRALSFERDGRWPTARAMLDALAPSLAATRASTPRSTTLPRGVRASRSKQHGEPPVVRGNLRETPLLQLLQHLHARRLSGRLQLGSPDQDTELTFLRGVPIEGTAVATLAEAALADRDDFTFEGDLRDADDPSSNAPALAAMLAVARKTPRRNRFAALMSTALAQLGSHPIRLRRGAVLASFAPTAYEVAAIDAARDRGLSLAALLAADVAPADTIERLVYALGVAGALDLDR